MSLRTLVIWVIIAGVLGGAALLVRDRQANEHASQEAEWVGLQFDPASVTEIQLGGAGGEVLIGRDPDSLDRWVGTWSSDAGDETWTLSASRVRGALRALATAQIRLGDDELMQDQAGELVIASRSGQTTTVQLGSGRSGGRTPVRVEQRDESGAIERVLSGWIESSVLEALSLQGVRSWRDPRLMDEAASSITRVGLVAGAYSVSLERRRSGWWISEPIEVQADQQMVETLVKSLLAIEAKRFVDDAVDATMSGVGTPLAVIEIGSDESGSTLTIGKQADVGGDLLYARFEHGGRSSLIEVSTDALSKLTAVPDAYVSKIAGSFATTAVRTVSVLSREGRTKLTAQRDGSQWRLDDAPADTLTNESIDRLLSILLRQPAGGVRLVDAGVELPRVIAGVELLDGQQGVLGSYDIALEQGSAGMQLLVMRTLGDGRRVVWAYSGDDAQATGTWLTIAASRRTSSN